MFKIKWDWSVLNLIAGIMLIALALGNMYFGTTQGILPTLDLVVGLLNILIYYCHTKYGKQIEKDIKDAF